MFLIFEPNKERNNSKDTSRAWGDLTVKLYGGSTILTMSLWPDGRHVLKVPERRNNFGALVTSDDLVDLACAVDTLEAWLTRFDELGSPLKQITLNWPSQEG